MGKNLSLEDPKTLNEKISWLKLNDRTSLHTLCSDKYAVRQYIIEKIGDDFVVPLFFMTLNYREIILENLPDEPSIINTNHDSGGGIFVYNKNATQRIEHDHPFMLEMVIASRDLGCICAGLGTLCKYIDILTKNQEE